MTHMFSSSVVSGSHHGTIKTHLHNSHFHSEFILQRSTYIAPHPTMKVQKVTSKTHEGKMYYEHFRAKGITSDLEYS